MALRLERVLPQKVRRFLFAVFRNSEQGQLTEEEELDGWEEVRVSGACSWLGES